MSAKSIFEADGKAILNYHLTRAPVIKPTPLPASATHNPPPKLASLHFPADADVGGILDQAEATYPWLLQPGARFVAKPDQLIKRRGKSGLLALNKEWPEAKAWIAERAGKPQRVETVDGVLRQFLVEPFVPHPQDTEYYININSVREVCPFPSLLSFSVQALSCISGGACLARRPHACRSHFACATAAAGCKSSVGSNTGVCPFCLQAGRTKGISPTHFCSAYTLPDTHVHFHMPIHSIFSACHNATCAVSICWLVLRLFSAARTGDRANHAPIHSLTYPLRVIGSCSPTRVVSMLAMLTRRLRSSSSPSTSRSTRRTRRSRPTC
jgi:hypothetical protein